MNIDKSKVTKTYITDVDRLDPITVYTEDFSRGSGQITILCYGQAWTSYWGGMGDSDIISFFCSCDEHYIAKNLSKMDSQVYDTDAIKTAAAKKGVPYYRDDPWNDYEFMEAMCGPDMYDWYDSLPKMANPEYRYLCRIILIVQKAFKS